MSYTAKSFDIVGGSVKLYTSIADGQHWITLPGIAQVFCVPLERVEQWAQTEIESIQTRTNNKGSTLYPWTDVIRFVKYTRKQVTSVLPDHV